jgi:thiol-disulfide isomerase/thioredoxin
VKRQLGILMIAAVAVAIILILGVRRVHRTPVPKTAGAAQQDKTAPDFALESLDGKTVHLSDFRGKAVLLNFWATWCEPCKIEMPWFVELQEQYGPDGLQIVGVSMDDEGPQEVAKFAKTMGVDYPILVGKESQTDAVASLYGGVQFLPVSIYIDREGKIVDKIFGLKGRSEIEDAIKKALGTSSPASKQALLDHPAVILKACSGNGIRGRERRQ